MGVCLVLLGKTLEAAADATVEEPLQRPAGHRALGMHNRSRAAADSLAFVLAA
jgi:hypothetical protein